MIGYTAKPHVAQGMGLKLAQLHLDGASKESLINQFNYNLNEVVFHESFYYTITRYPLLSAYQKRIMLKNAYDAMFFPMSNGLVEHTSSPFPTDLISNLIILMNSSVDVAKRGLASFHKTGFFAPVKDTVRLLQDINEKVGETNKLNDSLMLFLREFYVSAADMFYADYKANYPMHPTARVLLENNVQLPIKSIDPLTPGRVAFLTALALRHPDLYSICLDEEHAYATGDYTVINYKDFTFNTHFLTDVPFSLYHFNTIPKSVDFGSFKDRHSSTTLRESKVPEETYKLLIKELDAKGIHSIREINHETMEREMEFIEEFTNPYHVD